MSASTEKPLGGGKRPGHRRYWLALYRRDVAAAEAVVEQCLASWSPTRIYLRLFEPALNLSGTLWARGQICHQDEHFITHHTLRFLRRVRRKFLEGIAPATDRAPLALGGGVGQESHLIGLRMACDFLRREGWRTALLDSNDRATVAEAVARLRPAALLLSFGHDLSAEPGRRLIADLRRRGFKGLVAVGGGAIQRKPKLVEWLGADLTAGNGLQLVRLLRKRLPVEE